MQTAASTQRTKEPTPLPGSPAAWESRAPAASARRARASDGGSVVETTLLDLVRAVAEEARDEREVVATVLYMLKRGSVRLAGSFRGCERLDPAPSA